MVRVPGRSAQTLPVFAGYLVLGLGYGIYVQSLGLPVWLPPLMVR